MAAALRAQGASRSATVSRARPLCTPVASIHFPVVSLERGEQGSYRARAEVDMNLSLTAEEGRMLLRHLTMHLDNLETELLHTDRRELKRSLAAEVEALRSLADRLRSMAEQETTPDLV
jgi:hypothetical protein